MSLTLIGLGLFDENDISLRAIEEIKNSDKVYIELYTSKWHGNLHNLEKIVGKDIIELKRKDLEENSNLILKDAQSKGVSILVVGDPLIATTHSSVIIDAKKSGIKTKIIHNASIVSAIGETGLHIYKFGPIVTLPFKEKTKGKLPTSVFETIKENKKRSLHTLCLLDVVSDENRYMTVEDGLKILLSGDVVNQNDKIVVFTKAGSVNSSVKYDTVQDLIKSKILDVPAVIIISGKLHFTEEEYLS